MSDAPDRGSRVPPEERLAAVMEAHATPRRSVAAKALHELAQVDLAVYRAIAGTPTPTLDGPLRRLSGLANHSKLWVGAAAALFALGGPTGRRAAATGLVAVGINSAVVNLPMKLASRRERPDREAAGVPDERHVPMPTSTSFPSGHSASAFAFAGAVAGSIPVLGAPLRGLAAAVAYSRVHTGVHYPGDVIVGSVVGATIGEATALASACPAPSPWVTGRHPSTIRCRHASGREPTNCPTRSSGTTFACCAPTATPCAAASGSCQCVCVGSPPQAPARRKRLTAKNQRSDRIADEQQGEQPRSRPYPAGDDGRARPHGERHLHRSIHDVEPLGIGERLRGDGHRDQAHSHRARQQPCRVRWRARVMGVGDQAHHGRSRRRDRQCDRQVAQQPARQRARLGTRRTTTDEVEVDPPEAEPDHESDHPRTDRLEVVLRG